MVHPSRENEIKTEILRTLESYTSPEKSIGYNQLFDVVNSKVGESRRTFQKYLKELVETGAVRKEKDPRHRAGVIIYRTPSAKLDQALINTVTRASRTRELLSVLHPLEEQLATVPLDPRVKRMTRRILSLTRSLIKTDEQQGKRVEKIQTLLENLKRVRKALNERKKDSEQKMAGTGALP